MTWNRRGQWHRRSRNGRRMRARVCLYFSSSFFFYLIFSTVSQNANGRRSFSSIAAPALSPTQKYAPKPHRDQRAPIGRSRWTLGALPPPTGPRQTSVFCVNDEWISFFFFRPSPTFRPRFSKSAKMAAVELQLTKIGLTRFSDKYR